MMNDDSVEKRVNKNLNTELTDEFRFSCSARVDKEDETSIYLAVILVRRIIRPIWQNILEIRNGAPFEIFTKRMMQ